MIKPKDRNEIVLDSRDPLFGSRHHISFPSSLFESAESFQRKESGVPVLAFLIPQYARRYRGWPAEA